MLPETAGRFVVLNAIRFPHFSLPALGLPFKGECVITQGMNGRLTHHVPWNWALDFEVSHGGRRWTGSGEQLKDYYTFDRITLAPCDGTVVSVVSDVPDNAPGANNPEQNWGNYIVLYHDAGYYVLLAHLRQGSALVAAGQRVAGGQPIARCGNSGRSPLPHLHMHVQATPYPGAATLPFCLHHYAEIDSLTGRLRYRTSGQPQEEARLTWPTPLPTLRRFFANWLPGQYRYRIALHNQPTQEETIVLDFDEVGRYRFVSQRYRARLSMFLSEQVLYAVDYDGPGESVLALLSIGLARVPCVADPDCEWDDFASATPFRPRLTRRWHEIVDPFLWPGLLPYRYHLDADEHGFKISSRLTLPSSQAAPGRAVHQMKTIMSPQLGIERIEARLCNGSLLAATLIEPASVQPENPYPSIETTAATII
jgi:murein DD-endopeptidase MepM/ murein hydrolase activator NlpD